MKKFRTLGDKSKYLTKLLRHQPELEKLKLDEYGWCDVSILLFKLDWPKEELDVVVENNNKQRFRYNEDQTKIKANQGHSIPIKDDFKKMLPPNILFHGTSIDNKASIFQKGLSKMKRNHVHLSSDKETAKSVGMRYAKYQNKLWILSINAFHMNKDGYEFFLSENGVWLTDNVPAKYIINTKYNI